MNTFPLPPYVDPAVLRPGSRIEYTFDGTPQTLEVLRVEPALICRPVGATDVGDNELVILAHSAVPVREADTFQLYESAIAGQRVQIMNDALGDEPPAWKFKVGEGTWSTDYPSYELAHAAAARELAP